MKKRITTIATILLMVLAVASCKKDKTPKIKTETPMQATIAQGIVVDETGKGTGSPWQWEAGQKLYFTRNGRITKLGCRMPDASADGYYAYDVTLRDFNTGAKIVGVKVPVTDTAQFTYITISPVAVAANARFVVSVNTVAGGKRRHYYYRKSTNTAANSIYPFTTGSAVYEAFVFKAGLNVDIFPPTYPTTYNNFQNYIRGIADVEFEYDE